MSRDAPYVGDTTWSPVAGCTIGSIVSSFLSIGILAAYLPRPAPLTLPVTFLVAAGLLWVAAVAFLLRRPNFAWRLFFTVARWVLVLTLIFAAMAVFVFVYDRTKGAPLAILTVVLALAAIDVPMLVGFSVARHERVTG